MMKYLGFVSRWGRHGALALALVVGLAGDARATQPLAAFLDRATAQGFDAREVAATERQRVSEADVALGRLLPSLSARGVYTHNQYEAAATLPGMTERLVITPKNQLDAVLQLDVPIVDLANYHRYRAARAVAESAAEQRQAASIDISRGVARAYYQFLGASALLDAARASVSAAEANRSVVDDRRALGAATDLDHERALASLARAEQDVADATLGVALSARALESLSGLAPEPAAAFPEDDLHGEGLLAAWLERARESPAIRAGRKLTDASEATRTAASRSLLPTLSGSAQERVTNATGFAGRNAAYTLQLVLAWRLDYSTWAGQDAQLAALDAQRVRVERTERAVLDAAFEAFQRVEAGIAKSRAARVQAAAAARAAELSLDRYGAGVATQLDVTQAQRDAFQAAAARIQADADLAYARAALRLAAAVPLSSAPLGAGSPKP